MDLIDFRNSLLDEHPPDGLHILLVALWHDGKGDWEESHRIAQDIDTPEAAWVHAYLHRKEGDLWNAEYWYRRAGVARPDISLEIEWMMLVQNFI